MFTVKNSDISLPVKQIKDGKDEKIAYWRYSSHDRKESRDDFNIALDIVNADFMHCMSKSNILKWSI